MEGKDHIEEKSRQQMIEEILKRLCQVRTLHYDVIKDLLLQLKNITTTKGDEEESLLFMVGLAMKELKKSKHDRTDSEKNARLRNLLGDITNDLTNHINIYFPYKNSGAV